VRAWKSATTDAERVWLYFREHPNQFFTEDHVASQTGIPRRRCRRIVGWLAAEAKLEPIDTVSSSSWGRPKKMFRSVRTNSDSFRQLEVFRDALASAGWGDPYG
jgi:response regulator of citrate/malate metabolism